MVQLLILNTFSIFFHSLFLAWWSTANLILAFKSSYSKIYYLLLYLYRRFILVASREGEWLYLYFHSQNSKLIIFFIMSILLLCYSVNAYWQLFLCGFKFSFILSVKLRMYYRDFATFLNRLMRSIRLFSSTPNMKNTI